MATLSQRNKVTYAAAIKLAIFTVVSVMVTTLLAVIMGGFGLGGRTDYKAVFADASMLKDGDDVRVAGVSVGEVTKVEHYQRSKALVSFKVSKDVPLTRNSGAEIRYLNLVGARYMSLTQGDAGGQRLQEGATIPQSRTTPALNLTELFNGFQPLFAALNPQDVNELSLNLVRTLQGEGGTVQSLLSNTASLTNTLADRDELIGQVVKNLDSLLGTVDSRRQQLDQLIVSLKDWMTNLARDRGTIGASLQNVSTLTAQLATLLTDGRPYLKEDVKQLRRVMTLLAEPKNKALLDATLKRLPEVLTDQTRTGTYGSWYNYYLCDYGGSITLPADLPDIPGIAQIRKQLQNLAFHSTSPRCA